MCPSAGRKIRRRASATVNGIDSRTVKGRRSRDRIHEGLPQFSVIRMR